MRAMPIEAPFPIADSNDDCPRCRRAVRFLRARVTLGDDLHEYEPLELNFQCVDTGRIEGDVPPAFTQCGVSAGTCPSCGGLVIAIDANDTAHWIVPSRVTTPPLDDCVPASIQRDFREAVEVIAISPNASAVLARRALERVLQHAGIGTDAMSLAARIGAAKHRVHSALWDAMDLLRQVGNTAAHGGAATVDAGSRLVDVPDEHARLMLELLPRIIDELVVQPARDAEMTARLRAEYGKK